MRGEKRPEQSGPRETAAGMEGDPGKVRRTQARSHERELQSATTPPDVANPRAKSQLHGKVTADHWNQ